MEIFENSDALQAIINLTVELQAIWPHIIKLSALTGFVLVIASGFMCISNQNRMMMSGMGSMPTISASTTFFSGILLLNLTGYLFHVSDSLFADSSLSVLSYQTLNHNITDSTTLGLYLKFFVVVVKTVGLVAMFKSVILFRRSGSNPESVGPFILHGLFGSCAANIDVFLPYVVGDTLGGVYKTQIDNFFQSN